MLRRIWKGLVPTLLLILIGCGTSGLRAQDATLKGRVVDATDGTPLGYATVSRLNPADSSVLGGASADSTGSFELRNVSRGATLLRVTFVGYQPLYLQREVNASVMDLGQLKVQALQSETVEITEEVDMVQAGMEKTVYRVGKDISSAGSSAADVLQNVPSVTLDEDRKLQFRGNGNVQVLINGRPATLTGQGGLEQLPASMIDRVEIISNPSAKYDPDGTAGIINIVTKNNDEKGLSGSLTATAGTGDKYTTSVYLNYRRKKFSIYSNLAYNNNRFWNENLGERKNFTADTTFWVNSLGSGVNHTQGISANLGLDFTLSSHNTAGISGLMVRNQTDNPQTLIYDFLDEGENLQSQQIRNTGQLGSPLNLDATAYFKHTFENADHFISADFAFSGTQNVEVLGAMQYDPFSSASADNYQRTTTDNNRRILTPQVNYQRIWPKAGKLEAGLKAILRSIDQDFSSESSTNGSDYTFDTLISNHILYEDQVLSAYGVWSGTLKQWGYSVGLRAEQTYYSIDQLTTGQRYPFEYFNLFPTARIKRKLANGHEVGVSYSRRITRPNVEQLNPFPDWRDPYNLFSGNPFLRPEYTHSMEASYRAVWKRINFSLTAYYKHSDSTIMRYRTVNDDGVSFMTFNNIIGTRQPGAELVLQFEPAKWWNMNLNFNGSYQWTLAGNLSDGLSNQGFTGNVRCISNFLFWKGTSAQLLFNHNFPFVAPQGRGTPGTWVDMGIKKDFLPQKNLSLTFRVTDIFDTRAFQFRGAGENFEIYGRRKRESRIAYVGVSYRFGNGKPPAERKPSDDAPSDGGGM
jgi:outer membrane receptor protein involved in Fe transport